MASLVEGLCSGELSSLGLCPVTHCSVGESDSEVLVQSGGNCEEESGVDLMTSQPKGEYQLCAIRRDGTYHDFDK
jgi:hypothetical protein